MTDHLRSSRSPTVTWTPAEGQALSAYSARSAARKPERVYGWIVIALLAASTSLSLFDLYLLASGFG